MIIIKIKWVLCLLLSQRLRWLLEIFGSKEVNMGYVGRCGDHYTQRRKRLTSAPFV